VRWRLGEAVAGEWYRREQEQGGVAAAGERRGNDPYIHRFPYPTDEYKKQTNEHRFPVVMTPNISRYETSVPYDHDVNITIIVRYWVIRVRSTYGV
jgi:hypothetical protein